MCGCVATRNEGALTHAVQTPSESRNEALMSLQFPHDNSQRTINRTTFLYSNDTLPKPSESRSQAQ
eukprot:2273080-Amphidinium_carterae.1